MKVFTLYLGESDSGPPPRSEIIEQVTRHFESFTLVSAEGVFRGVAEQVCLIRIADDDTRQVVALAEELRARWNQKGVGIEHQGRYLRVRQGASLEGIAEELEGLNTR